MCYSIHIHINVHCISISFFIPYNCNFLPSNQWLEEAQAGLKIAGRNINNLRYADDTTLMAERGIKEAVDESERGE